MSKGSTLNEKVLNWHLLEDVLGWLAVLVVSIVMMFADWPILDPLLSVGFTLFILFNVIRNLWTTGKLFLQAVPDRAHHDEIRRTLLTIDGISDIHHQHLWSLDGEHHVLTAHIVVDGDFDADQCGTMKKATAETLEQFGLTHTTIEIELQEEFCREETKQKSMPTDGTE